MSERSEADVRLVVERVIRQVLDRQAQECSPSSGEKQPELDRLEATTGTARKTVAIGADHGGFELKELLKADLAAAGYPIVDVGTHSKEPVDYPDFAHEVARMVASGKAWRGIVVDGAGIGSCIVANKVPGVRAGLAYDYSSALNAREHNDTNVLTLGAGLIGPNLARQITKTWLETPFGGGRHVRRVEKILAIEKNYLK